jgi:hypothetical protein
VNKSSPITLGTGCRKSYRYRLSGFKRIASSSNSLRRTISLAGPLLQPETISQAQTSVYPIDGGRKALIDGAGLKSVAAWGNRLGNRPGV